MSGDVLCPLLAPGGAAEAGTPSLYPVFKAAQMGKAPGTSHPGSNAPPDSRLQAPPELLPPSVLPISESEWRARVCLSVIPAADTGGAASPEAWPENSNCWSCSGLVLALGWKVLALPQNPGGAKEPSPPMGFRTVSPLIARSRWRRRFNGPPRWRAIRADLLHSGSSS